MKALWCKHCSDVALLPGGHTYYIGQAPSRFPFAFKDARCKRQSSITAYEWNLRPDEPDAKMESGVRPAPIIARDRDWSPPKKADATATNA